MGYLIWRGEWQAAAVVLWLAIATDMADGYLARRFDSETSLGGLLDHSSDAFFVALALVALASHGLVPFALPVLVVLAFSQYMADSRALAGRPLRTSHLGRYNGICYFILAGFPVMEHALDLYPIPLDYFPWLAWGLVISTIISMADRLHTLLRGAPDHS